MTPKTKTCATARTRTYRALNALRIAPGNQERAEAVRAAYATLAEACIDALRNPQPDHAPTPRTSNANRTDPADKHRATAARYLETARQLERQRDQDRADAAAALQSAARMASRDSYSLDELTAKRAEAAKAETRAANAEKQMHRASKLAAAAMARAEGKPRPPRPPAAPIDKGAHARRVMRWQATEQRLEHVRDVWAARMADAAEALDNRSTDKAAAWHQRCRDYLHQATARLAAYRRDHGLTAPPTPDPLEKDENGEYIL